MNVDYIKRIVKEQEEEMEEILKGDIIPREYEEVLFKYLSRPNILAITGIRRSGKSVLAMLLKRRLKLPSAYINFDDERLVGLDMRELVKVEQAFYELYGDVDVMIFDEIQNVEGWELFLNRLRRRKRIIITGSNSELMHSELSTHLTGRYIDVVIFPFSFREFTGMKLDSSSALTTKEIAEIRRRFNQYVEGSSFPEYKFFGKSIVRRIYEDIVNKDCVRRYSIKQERTFKDLTYYIISNYGNLFTYRKLKDIFNIGDVHTVKNYISYLENSFLIIVLNKFSYKLKEHEKSPKKVYPMEHGFANFLAFRRTRDMGRLYETLVAVELLRQNSLRDEKREIYYYRDRNGYEVDFVIKYGERVEKLIQVSISDGEMKEREYRSLLIVSKELKCDDLLIINEEKEGIEEVEWRGIRKRIRFIPLWRWLLTHT